VAFTPIANLRSHAVPQDVGGIALAKPLERPIAQLSNALARHSELVRDLLQRHGTIPLQTKIQRQHTTIARWQNLERARDRLSPRLTLDTAGKNVLILATIEHQRFGERPSLLTGACRLVERPRRLQQRDESTRHVEGEVRDRRDLILMWLARQLLPKHFLRARHA